MNTAPHSFDTLSGPQAALPFGVLRAAHTEVSVSSELLGVAAPRGLEALSAVWQYLFDSMETGEVLKRWWQLARGEFRANALRWHSRRSTEVIQLGQEVPALSHRATYRLRYQTEVLGDLELLRSVPFIEAELAAIERMLSLVVLPLRNAEHFAEVRRHATTDALTGLANRAAFDAALKHASTLADRYGHPASLLVIDLNHFKAINDDLGHAVGDEALRLVAGVLRDSIRQSDLAFRLGGDEFVLLLPECSLERATAIATRIEELLLERPLRASGQARTLELSYGAAEWRPGEAVESWLARADSAMYLDKRARHAERRAA